MILSSRAIQETPRWLRGVIVVSAALVAPLGLTFAQQGITGNFSNISVTFSPVPQDQQSPGTFVLNGADDPDSISMALAYDQIFRGKTYLSEALGNEGIPYSVENFYLDEVGLDDHSAEVVAAYALEGLAELNQIGKDQNAARCADRDQFTTKAKFGERLKADTELFEIERARVWNGVFAELDVTNGETLRRYATALRSSIVLLDADPVTTLQNSPETIEDLLRRGCSVTSVE